MTELLICRRVLVAVTAFITTHSARSKLAPNSCMILHLGHPIGDNERLLQVRLHKGNQIDLALIARNNFIGYPSDVIGKGTD
jgi:hypothetical protein